MSGTAKPCHGIVCRRVGVAAPLLLLAAIACGGQRPGASNATASSSASPVTSAAPTQDAAALHPASQRILGELQGPLWLELYVSPRIKGLQGPAKEAERLLRGYERAGHGRVKLAVHHVGQDVAAEAAREAGMVEVGKYQSEELGYLGLTMRYGDQRAVIPSFSVDGPSGLEFWITNKIRELRDLREHRQHRIGVVTGKGELKLSDPVLAPSRGSDGPSLASIMKQAFPFYVLVPVDLQAGKVPIDAGLEGLIITQPAQDYALSELQRIDQFLLLGNKSLAVFASAVNLAPGSPQMQGTLSPHGLEKLLSGYGVELETNVLWDNASSFKVEVSKDDGTRATFRYPLIPIVRSSPETPSNGPLDASAVPFFRLDQLAFPFASSLRLAVDKQPADVAFRGIARSTDETSSTHASPVNLRPASSYPRGEMRSHLLAATVQGRLRSAFPLPLGDGKLGPVAPAPSRLLVIASSTYLANPFVYADSATSPDPMVSQLAQPYVSNLTSTIVSFKNTLDWMLAAEDFVELSATIVPPSR